MLAGPAVTLAIGLRWTFDNVNTIKLLVLSVVAGFSAAQVFFAIQTRSRDLLLPPLLMSLLFLTAMAQTVFFSGSPIAQQIYGTTGRNLGFLHYFFLTLVFLGISTLKTKVMLSRIFHSLIFVGVFEAAYGVLQHFNLDPLPWNNVDGWIFGTFGNPNYLSSFLALSSTATLFVTLGKKKIAAKFLYLLFFFLQSVVIYLSDSSQGLILLIFGIFSLAVIAISTWSKILALVVAFFGTATATLAVFGVFQIGPLRNFLYQDSVSYRGDYWRAGIEMIKSNMLHGVGLDSYGDFYRKYRDHTAAYRRGLDVYSNSAHNVFIDLGATGGVILLASYLSFLALVAVFIISTLRKTQNVGIEFKCLIVLWLAFNLQTIISVNVPSLGVWGWVFSGLIVGYNNDGQRIGELSKKKFRAPGPLMVMVFCALTISFVLPYFIRDAKLAGTFENGDYQSINQALEQFPIDASQVADVATAYEKMGNDLLALNLARIAVTENGNAGQAWKVILESANADESERVKARKVLTQLDPFFMSERN